MKKRNDLCVSEVSKAASQQCFQTRRGSIHQLMGL